MDGVAEDDVIITNKDYSLKSNVLHTFYFEFNENCNVNDDNSQCVYFLSNKDVGNAAKELYKKFVRNINTLTKHSSHFNSIDKGIKIENRCIYFIYWFYDQLLSKNISQTEIDAFFKEWEIQKNNMFVGNDYACEIYNIKLNEIKKIKKLYNYLVSYDRHKNYRITNDKRNNNIYCYYIKGFFNLYNEIATTCNGNNEGEHCKVFRKNIKKYIKENVLTTLNRNCVNNNVTTEPEDVDKSKDTGDHKKKSEKYNIFDDLAIHQKIESKGYDTTGLNEYSTICQNISCPNNHCKKDPKVLCEDFFKLFMVLSKVSINDYKVSKYNLEYLNYWFNQQLRDNVTNDDDRKTVLKAFSDKCIGLQGLDKLKEKIHFINDDDYTKMNIMYNLYYNYYKIDTNCIEKKENSKIICSEYANLCVEKYKNGIAKYIKGDDDFYDAMNEFNVLYKNIKYRTKSLIDVELPALPEIQLLKESEQQSQLKKSVVSFQNEQTIAVAAVSEENKEYDYILKDSSVQKIYKKFNEKSVDVNTCAKYCNKIIHLEEKHNGIKNICAKIVTNLKNLSDIKDLESSHKKRCSHLTYWSYNEIRNIFKTNENKILDESVSSELNEVILRVNNDLPTRETCIYYFDDNFDEWNEEKYLHDYFENYTDLAKINLDAAQDIKYCKYINHIYDLYRKHIVDCCTCYSNSKLFCEEKCPKYFKCNKEYVPNNLLLQFKCIDETSAKYKEKIHEMVTIDRIVKWVTEKSHEKPNLLGMINSNSLGVSDTTYYANLYDPFYSAMIICFVFLGILMFLFVSYKFTPIGSLFHKNVKKKNINYNLHEDYEQKFLEYDSNYGNVDLHDKRIRLRYNPLYVS
ncbi:PIR protein [Plasmodium ovale]|uniref:PIR Superfamily Protein n=2 Tax=Plasmodium ovale TaxID=36330 RepID=A0A1A8VN67_PLAOA|nr:PIR Superfamily Protein [Plasmodium ovale curtisi]SBT00695.1 PIR Superfamily Protein [Plasmodium ovale curtisi]SBT84901.1 PIR protein [Plasmodium ovale]